MAKPLEWYIENADELAQKVVNVWGPYAQAGQQDALGPEFLAVFDKACRHKEAKDLADNHREFGMLSVGDETRERDARIAFAEAYKAQDDVAAARSAAGGAGA
jgi:hypothetical protein